MADQVISNVLGELTQNVDIDEWLDSEKVAIPFFDNQKFAFIFMDKKPDFVDESDSAITNFLSLSREDRLKISDLVYQNCDDFLQAIGYDEADKSLWKITDKTEIWNFVTPTHLYISKRDRRDCDFYIQIACECVWEQEHGLQLVFRQGKKLTRVSQQDGHLTDADAYDKPDNEDKLLSAF